MYSRKSIGDYLKRKNQTYGPAVSFVLDAFSKIQDARRSIIPDCFPKTDSYSNECNGISFSSLPCHMDPSFYVSPMIHFGLMVLFNHRLNFAEMVSIFRAWAAMPFTSYYFVSGCIVLLWGQVLPSPGLLLGHSLLLIMKQLRKDHQDWNTKIPGLRFSTYRKLVVPLKKEWEESTKEIVRLCLAANYRHETPGDKKERATFYEKTRKSISKQIPDGGSLVTNHLMNILAIVGVVPLWFAEEHSVDTSSKSIQYLVKNKGLAKGKHAAERFLDSVASALQRQHGITASRKYTENVCCKAFRRECTVGSDHRFSDLLFDNQCVFQTRKSSVRVYRRGFQEVVVDGPLIEKWSFDGKFWTMQQLLLHFKSTSVVGFEIPKGLGILVRKRLSLQWTKDIFSEPSI